MSAHSRRGWFGRSRPLDQKLEAGRSRRLRHEPLEDRRMLTFLIGPGDDFPAFNDVLPPGGQVIGGEPTVTIQNFTVDNVAGDPRDVFRYTAHSTGKLLINVVGTNGDYTFDLQDNTGTSVMGGAATNTRRIVPVVEGVQYWLVVTDTLAGGAGTTYFAEMENFAAPTAASVSLSPASDTGPSNSDNITSVTTPTFFIQADLGGFLTGPPAQQIGVIDSNGAVGYDVQLVATNTITGAETTVNATRLGTSATWTAAPGAALPSGSYLVSARSVVVDGTTAGGGGPNTGFSLLSSPIFVTILPTPNVGVGTIDLLASSDTGVFNTDNVTSTPTPAFTGVGPANDRVRVFAQATDAGGAPLGAPLLVASGVVGSDNTDGAAGDGQGQWQLTSIPIADGFWLFTAEFEDAAGTLSAMTPVPGLGVEIDSAAPNLPLLDLTVASDSGRNNADNITNVTAPVVTLTTFDPPIPATNRLFTDNLRYLVYDRVGTAAEVLLYDSSLDPAVEPTTVLGDVFTSLNFVTTTLPALAAGDHNLRLEVVDRAGNISQSFVLPVTVDVAAPPVSFGQVTATSASDGLFNGSDTGVPTNGASYSDRVTSDTTPTLWGRAEADSIVTLYLDLNNDGVIQTAGATPDLFLGQAVAVPLDGNNAFAGGSWEITSAIDLNDLTTLGAGFARDGVRRLLVTAQDVAGNPAPVGAIGAIGTPPFVAGTTIDALSIFLDTQGPQITSLAVNGLPSATAGGFNLFATKPLLVGPTPPINSITINFRDLPTRLDSIGPTAINDFLYPALDPTLAANLNNYAIIGDHVGHVPIASVVVNQAIKLAATVTAAAAAGSNTVTSAGLVGVAVGDFLVYNNGANAGQTRRVTAFAAGVATLDAPLAGAQAAGEGFAIVTAASMLYAGAALPNTAAQASVTSVGNSVTTFTAAGLANVPVVGNYIRFNTGANAGQIRRVAAVAGTTITVEGFPNAAVGGFPVAPVAGDSFTVLMQTGTALNTASVTLNFAPPLADDRFTLVVSDNLTDPAGNKLDGESNAAQPGAPFFPSGNGVTGGSFAGRFTVDSRPEIGSYVSQNIAIDINGNGVWDPAAPLGGDQTNVDLSFTMDAFLNGAAIPGNQSPHELLVAGKFTAIGTNQPGFTFFDQLATYGNYNGSWQWLIDLDSDGAVFGNGDPDGVNDLIVPQGILPGFDATARAGALPVAGNFDSNLANGDEIGLYYRGLWAIDTNHDFILDRVIGGNLLGAPIVGDFDGNGVDDLAVFRDNTFYFDLSVNTLVDATATSQATLVWGFPGVLDTPVAADMNNDGVDDIGLWVPRDSAATAPRLSEWYFLVSTTANPPVGTLAALNHPFSPPPFPGSTDLYFQFGDDRALPIVGNFDPPVVAASVQQQFAAIPGDYDGSGIVDEGDRAMWRQYFGTTNPQADGNGDGVVDIADYTLWRDHLGMQASPLVAAPAVAAAYAAPDMLEDLAAIAEAEPTAGAAFFLLGGAQAQVPSLAARNAAVTDEDGADDDEVDALLLILASATPDRLDDTAAGADPYADWDAQGAYDRAYEGYGASEVESDGPEALASGVGIGWS